MVEYWNSVKIAAIKEITGIGGAFSSKKVDAYFGIHLKDGTKHYFHYNDQILAGQERETIKKLYNEFNQIPETYLLLNEAHAQINGTWIPFGYEVSDALDHLHCFTLLEIEKLRQQFKIRDDGWRQLVAITMLKIEGNKVIIPEKVPQRYLEQLTALGYDIKHLEFEMADA